MLAQRSTWTDCSIKLERTTNGPLMRRGTRPGAALGILKSLASQSVFSCAMSQFGHGLPWIKTFEGTTATLRTKQVFQFRVMRANTKLSHSLKLPHFETHSWHFGPTTTPRSDALLGLTWGLWPFLHPLLLPQLSTRGKLRVLPPGTPRAESEDGQGPSTRSDFFSNFHRWNRIVSSIGCHPYAATGVSQEAQRQLFEMLGEAEATGEALLMSNPGLCVAVWSLHMFWAHRAPFIWSSFCRVCWNAGVQKMSNSHEFSPRQEHDELENALSSCVFFFLELTHGIGCRLEIKET